MRLIAGLILSITLSSFALAVEPSAQVVAGVSRSATKKVPSEDAVITNFHVVVEGRVFRGARPKSQSQISRLFSEYNIKTIINLQGADPHPFDVFEPGESKRVRYYQKLWATQSGIKNWINIPLNSWDKVTKSEAQKINKILAIINDPTSQPVYVHCEHGKDRTGLVIALFQVFDQAPPLTPSEALSKMYEYGHSKYLRAMDDYFSLATAPPMSLLKLDTMSFSP
jgi:protein tyrosine/serine phosphatase